MYELVYHSKARSRINKSDITDILEISRANNKKYSITGCLIYFGKKFIQILEGDKSAVHNIYSKIEQDNRHFEVTLFYHGPKMNREFKKWSMGYFEGDNSIMQTKFGISENALLENSHRSKETVKEFWQSIKKIIE
ncbi:BLUF domain-containing protein [Ekhidna sp.]|uniref:BLUF domain-containing protein n=1 Tax=Ekhidna sp. TaxID=2608089 RepID=UPI0032EFD003